jgi:hypothetical protein
METRQSMTNSLSFIQRLGSAKQIMVPFGNPLPSPCHLLLLLLLLLFLIFLIFYTNIFLIVIKVHYYYNTIIFENNTNTISSHPYVCDQRKVKMTQIKTICVQISLDKQKFITFCMMACTCI